MRQTAFFFLLLFIQTGVSAQATDYRKQQNYKEWVHLAPKFDDAFSGQKKHNVSETMYCYTSKSPEAGPKTSICRQN